MSLTSTANPQTGDADVLLINRIKGRGWGWGEVFGGRKVGRVNHFLQVPPTFNIKSYDAICPSGTRVRRNQSNIDETAANQKVGTGSDVPGNQEQSRVFEM